MTEELTAEEELAFCEYMDTHPFIEAYAEGECQPFRPYAQLIWQAAVRWQQRQQEGK